MPPPKRTVILHYHLFKNAGTSLDRVLKRNFGTGWVEREFPMQPGGNTAEVEAWIRDRPQATAFSTHTALSPLPRVKGVRVVSVMLLRDPVERIRSAYRFERRREADNWGAKLARKNDCEGYVRARLDRPGDRQCRNFQTHRLASLQPGDEPELTRALNAAHQITVLGRVSHFDTALHALAAEIADVCPDFTWDETRANVSAQTPENEAENPALDAALEEANADDRTLLARVWGEEKTNVIGNAREDQP